MNIVNVLPIGCELRVSNIEVQTHSEKRRLRYSVELFNGHREFETTHFRTRPGHGIKSVLKHVLTGPSEDLLGATALDAVCVVIVTVYSG